MSKYIQGPDKRATLDEGSLGGSPQVAGTRIFKTASGRIYAVDKVTGRDGASFLGGSQNSGVNVYTADENNNEDAKKEILSDWSSRPESSSWHSPSNVSVQAGGTNAQQGKVGGSYNYPANPLASAQKMPGTINGKLV